MKEYLIKLVDKCVQGLPSQVNLNIPKLKKVGGDDSPKIKLPKLKKIK